MQILVQSIGILIVCLTAVAFFSPGTMRQAVGFFREGKRLYAAAAARIIIGAILIWAAFYCKVMGVVFTIGVVVLLSGAIAIAMGLPRMTTFVDWWLAKSDNVLRAMACVSFLFGAALIYAA